MPARRARPCGFGTSLRPRPSASASSAPWRVSSVWRRCPCGSRSEPAPPAAIRTARCSSPAPPRGRSPRSLGPRRSRPSRPSIRVEGGLSGRAPSGYFLVWGLLPLLDDLRQLSGASGIEGAQPVQDLARVFQPPHLDEGLAEVLERFRELGTEPQGLVVGLEGLRVATLVAQGVPELVPGLRERGAQGDRLAEGGLGSLPVLRDAGPDPAVVLALGTARGRGLAPLLDRGRARIGQTGGRREDGHRGHHGAE